MSSSSYWKGFWIALLALTVWVLLSIWHWWRGYRGLDQWPNPYGRYYDEWMSDPGAKDDYYLWLAKKINKDKDPWVKWAYMEWANDPDENKPVPHLSPESFIERSGMQELISAKLAHIEKRRQEIIDRGAKAGTTIEVEALRRKIENSKAAYTGPDRDAYAREVDRLKQSLAKKYGSRIPVDDAYRIMQKLEAGTYSDEV